MREKVLVQFSAPGWDHLQFRWPALFFTGGSSLTETDPLQVPAPDKFPASWHWQICLPVMESSHFAALLTHSVFFVLQMLSFDTDEVDIPYTCYTRLDEHRSIPVYAKGCLTTYTK